MALPKWMEPVEQKPDTSALVFALESAMNDAQRIQSLLHTVKMHPALGKRAAQDAQSHVQDLGNLWQYLSDARKALKKAGK